MDTDAFPTAIVGYLDDGRLSGSDARPLGNDAISETSPIVITNSKRSGRSVLVTQSCDPDAPIAIRTTTRKAKLQRNSFVALSTEEAVALDQLLDRAFGEFTKSAKKTLIGTFESRAESITRNLSVVINGLSAPILVTQRHSIGSLTIRRRRVLMRQADIPPISAQLQAALENQRSVPANDAIVNEFPKAEAEQQDAA